MAKEYFWGGKLTDKESLKWDPESEYADDDDSQDDAITHYLFLKQAVLGAEAKEGERNVIEVETANFEGDIVTQPLLSLKVGLNESTQLDIGLQPPVTFKLAVGTGPVYLTGQHALELQDYDDDDVDDDDYKVDSKLLLNEAEEGEEEEEEEDDEEDDEDELDVSPEKKQVAGAKDKKKAEVSKKVAKKDDKVEAEAAGKGKKRPAPSSSGAAKKMALGDDDEDEEGDSEDDDEDEEMDEDEEDEEESSPEKPAKKTKGKVNGTTKSKDAPKQAQEKQKGKKEKKMTTYSVDDVKADLLKSPSKPKKEEKFTNFVKSRYHVTDSKKVQELWGWYKKTQLK